MTRRVQSPRRRCEARPRMDLEALRAFLAVVETGSFVSAATTLRWARATLRRRVDELEQKAGVPLLVRTGQGATPTEAGRVLAARGREILAESAALLSSVREVGAAPSGLVRVVLPVGLPPDVLLPIYASVRATHPKLRLSVRTSDDPVSELLHDVDVAICFGAHPPEGPWVTREILRVHERLLASPRYLERRGAPRSVAALGEHELFVWAAPGEREPTVRLRDGSARRVSPALHGSDIHFLRQCAAAELGLVYAPDAGVADVDRLSLVPVLDAEVGTTRSLRVVLPSAISDIPRIRAVLEIAEGLLPLASPRAKRPRRGP